MLQTHKPNPILKLVLIIRQAIFKRFSLINKNKQNSSFDSLKKANCFIISYRWHCPIRYLVWITAIRYETKTKNSWMSMIRNITPEKIRIHLTYECQRHTSSQYWINLISMFSSFFSHSVDFYLQNNQLLHTYLLHILFLSCVLICDNRFHLLNLMKIKVSEKACSWHYRLKQTHKNWTEWKQEKNYELSRVSLWRSICRMQIKSTIYQPMITNVAISIRPMK